MLTNDLDADAADGDGQPGAWALVTGAKIATATFIAVLALWGLPARAQPSASASVSVTITVEPIAQVEFPSGLDFIIHVPDRDRCHVPRGYPLGRAQGLPLRMGQRLLVRPQDMVVAGYPPRAHSLHGHRQCAGLRQRRAERVPAHPLQPLSRPGRRSAWRLLGYDIVVHFPAPERDYHWLPGWADWNNWGDWRGWHGFGYLPRWSRFAMLPGVDGEGTPPLTADMVDLHGSAYGVIYVVARRTWTPDGRPAEPGAYAGRLDSDGYRR